MRLLYATCELPSAIAPVDSFTDLADMTITVSYNAYWNLFQEIDETHHNFDPSDELDTTWRYPRQLGQGILRGIELREGVWLDIADYRPHDDVVIKFPEDEHSLQYVVFLLGEDQYNDLSCRAGHYALCGSGMAPEATIRRFANQRLLKVNVQIEPEILRSFIGGRNRELPPEVQHLLRPSTQVYNWYLGTTTPTMQIIVWQILQCPYQGFTKRIYLESKIMELLTLLLEQDAEIQTGNRSVFTLKPGTLERIHYAKEILLKQLDNPPSMSELAQQVKLNEYTLKRGFRQVFGTTVFGYLHDYRLKQASQLLETGQMNVTEVAQAVGFADRSYFAAAFRKRFGVNPKQYLMQRKISF